MLQHEGDDMFFKSKVKTLVQSVVEHPLVVEEGKNEVLNCQDELKHSRFFFFKALSFFCLYQLV